MIQKKGVPFPLIKTDGHPCPYFPSRTAAELMVLTHQVTTEAYEGLMAQGFRRSESYLYRPDCKDCRACVPIRIPVESFCLSKSQRRVLKNNSDLVLKIGKPTFDRQRYEMYERYQLFKHRGTMSCTEEQYQKLFCSSPVDTLEMSYWLKGQLLGLGIVDVCRNAMSSVYFSFEPEQVSRSLGVYSALCEIEECRRNKKAYWYLGYYVEHCSKMDYKTRFGPHEFFKEGQGWSCPERGGKVAPDR